MAAEWQLAHQLHAGLHNMMCTCTEALAVVFLLVESPHEFFSWMQDYESSLLTEIQPEQERRYWSFTL